MCNVYNGQEKPYLRRKKERAKRLEGLLEIVNLETTVKRVGADIHLKS